MSFVVANSEEVLGKGYQDIAGFEGCESIDRDNIQTYHIYKLTSSRKVRSLYSTKGKRAFDVVLAALMLLFAAPLLLILMAIVAIDGGKPIFAHSRVGQFGRHFDCLKIRSMQTDAEQRLEELLAADPAAAAEWEANRKIANDPRITRVGSFLRRSSFDELPQLINVLRGDMSLVGPRPITAGEIKCYGAAAATYLAMKPGLTGPWQIAGRNDISFAERVALDVNYTRNYDFSRDLAIIAKTGLAVLRLTGR